MPFTFSHPAIILPLSKLKSTRLSATAMILGSMSPDFEYFIHMRMYQEHGHSLLGLFYFDLPMTIALCFIFHAFVRRGLIAHSPKIIREKYAEFSDFNWIQHFKKHWFMIGYSAMIGIVSHVFWDAFTHSNGLFVEYIPFLQGKTNILGYVFTNTDLAQMGSSLLGALVIAGVLFWPKDRSISLKIDSKIFTYWFLVCLITFLVLVLRGVENAGDIIATTISGGLIGLIITPSLLNVLKLKR
ncbi:DUF4184 family protein [Crocinitomix catalasitica]|uniref:DUF4184 family protein n=1 Tax=Crocinitomix catalasitica TaxID=184607 RepID=UPI0004858CCB|nr:DUF4184 family protein [Crocinitomix catalasitica]